MYSPVPILLEYGNPQDTCEWAKVSLMRHSFRADKIIDVHLIHLVNILQMDM